MSPPGTKRTWRDVRHESAFGGKAENIYSERVFRLLTLSGSHAPWMLSPIVDDIGAGAAIAGIVLPVHGHALNFGPKSAGDEVAIGFLACHVRTSQQVRHAGSDRQSLTRVEQPKIIVFGRSPVADCT